MTTLSAAKGQGRTSSAWHARRGRQRRGALDLYASWTARISTPRDRFEIDTFEPMWLYPTHPSIVTASEKLFRARGSWLPIAPMAGAHDTGYDRGGLLGHGLAKLPALNDYLLEALADQRHIGTLTVLENDAYEITYVRGGKEGGRLDETDLMLKGANQDVRVADWYASRLAGAYQNAPRFGLHWRRGLRDGALLQTRRWLEAQRPK